MRQIKLRINELIAEKEARDGTELSANAIAQAIGVSHNTILSYMRNDGTTIDLRILYKLAQYFGCESRDLFKDLDSELNAAALLVV